MSLRLRTRGEEQRTGDDEQAPKFDPNYPMGIRPLPEDAFVHPFEQRLRDIEARVEALEQRT